MFNFLELNPSPFKHRYLQASCIINISLILDNAPWVMWQQQNYRHFVRILATIKIVQAAKEYFLNKQLIGSCSKKKKRHHWRLTKMMPNLPRKTKLVFWNLEAEVKDIEADGTVLFLTF